jgi:hypothetical protein
LAYVDLTTFLMICVYHMSRQQQGMRRIYHKSRKASRGKIKHSPRS